MQRGLYRSMTIQVVGVCLALLLLVACSGGTGEVQTTDANETTETITGPAADNATGNGENPAGPQTCPAIVSLPSRWDPIVPTQTDINQVEQVTCAYLAGSSDLQALVTVRSIDEHSRNLDIYVYTGITHPTPERIFELRNLYQGEVQLSGYNSLITAEGNPTGDDDFVGNEGAVDIHREFVWSAGVATLVPVAFPGIYPLTRYEANTIQHNDSERSQWLDAATVARNFVMDERLLGWSAEPQITRGGGAQDSEAEATVAGPGGGSVTLLLQRFEKNTSDGIWIVTSVTSDGLEISSPQGLDHLSQSVTVTGRTGLISTVSILDHGYDQLAETNASGDAFSANLTYESPFKKGMQEGLIALFATNAGGQISGFTVVKVLL